MNLPAEEAFLAKVKELVVPYALSVQAREALLMEAFYTSNRWILGEVLFDGNANEFATHCITTLLERDPTLTLLEILLITLQPMHGVTGQAEIRELLDELPTLSFSDSRGSIARTAVQPASSGRERPTLFVSYAAEEAELAQRLADALGRYGHDCQLERHAERGSDGWLAATAEGLSNAYAVSAFGRRRRRGKTAGCRWSCWRRWISASGFSRCCCARGGLPGFLAEGHPDHWPLMRRTLIRLLQALLRRLPEAAIRIDGEAHMGNPFPPRSCSARMSLSTWTASRWPNCATWRSTRDLSGEAQFQRTRGDKLVLPSVVARQELTAYPLAPRRGSARGSAPF